MLFRVKDIHWSVRFVMSDEIDRDKGGRSLISTLISPGPDCRESVKLPTLQRNALRKLFDRPEFSPQDVYELGFKRLQRAEGIGDKGMLAIVAWLKVHRLELLLPPPPARPTAGYSERSPAKHQRRSTFLAYSWLSGPASAGQEFRLGCLYSFL